MSENEAFATDGTFLVVLSIIERLNKDAKIPHKGDLVERLTVFKSSLDSMLINLLELGYIRVESNWNRYFTYTYSITQKGRNVLQQSRALAMNNVLSIMHSYRNNEMEALYFQMKDHRESLWFAYHEGYITKEELRRITKLLGSGARLFSWDRDFEKWVDRFFESYRFA